MQRPEELVKSPDSSCSNQVQLRGAFLRAGVSSEEGHVSSAEIRVLQRRKEIAENFILKIMLWPRHNLQLPPNHHPWLGKPVPYAACLGKALHPSYPTAPSATFDFCPWQKPSVCFSLSLGRASASRPRFSLRVCGAIRAILPFWKPFFS